MDTYFDRHCFSFEVGVDMGALRELGPHFELESIMQVLVLLDIMSPSVGCWGTHICLPANKK